jgi:hypothetical protein
MIACVIKPLHQPEESNLHALLYVPLVVFMCVWFISVKRMWASLLWVVVRCAYI